MNDGPVPAGDLQSRSTSRLISTLLGGVFTLTAAQAAAQDLSETRLFPENPFWEANNEGWPFLYGQINKGFLVHGDGDGTNFYPLVDNANSSTRAGITYKENWWSNVSVFGNVEGEWNPYSSARVNQNTNGNVDWDAYLLRKFEANFEIDEAGRFWFGQGSMASDASAEQDVSGTGVIAYSSIADSAGGQFFALNGGQGLSNVKIGDAFSNLDGLGRKMRFRYDTPSILGGARLSGSIGYDALGGGNDTEWDVAATYGRSEPGEAFAMAAAIAYSKPGGDDQRISSSASILHQSSGISLTIANGYNDTDKSSRDPVFVYGKLGYLADFTSLGPTAFGIDLFVGRDFENINSESFSVGLAGVQTIEYQDTAFDIYGLVRHHNYDDNNANYENGMSFLTGARWRF